MGIKVETVEIQAGEFIGNPHNWPDVGVPLNTFGIGARYDTQNRDPQQGYTRS